VSRNRTRADREASRACARANSARCSRLRFTETSSRSRGHAMPQRHRPLEHHRASIGTGHPAAAGGVSV
jgi:hypothetical protein